MNYNYLNETERTAKVKEIINEILSESSCEYKKLIINGKGDYFERWVAYDDYFQELINIKSDQLDALSLFDLNVFLLCNADVDGLNPGARRSYEDAKRRNELILIWE